MQADGLIQETPEQTLLELLPFELNVATPPVLATGAVFRGTIAEGVPPGDVGGLYWSFWLRFWLHFDSVFAPFWDQKSFL